jgi:hypothetical protein
MLRIPLALLPFFVGMVAQNKVSMRRIEAFLGLEERLSDPIEEARARQSENAIYTKKATFGWVPTTLSSE